MGRYHQRQGNHNPRNKACNKNRTDGFAGGNTVHDQSDAGGNNHTQLSRGSNCGGCEVPVIALFEHFRNNDATYCCSGGNTGTGDCREKGTGRNGNHTQAASHVSNQRIAQIDQPP
jgi:hypothetical protein